MSSKCRSLRFAAMKFPERLTALRHERGLTQAVLADRAELNVSQLRRYEAGTSEPSLAALRRLAIALSVTTDALVFGDDTRGPDNDELRMAFEATRFLDPDEQATVTALLDAFLARHDNRDSHEGPRHRRTRPTNDGGRPAKR
jgi:transcriptional regulator with XRE-family HTH domain